MRKPNTLILTATLAAALISGLALAHAPVATDPRPTVYKFGWARRSQNLSFVKLFV